MPRKEIWWSETKGYHEPTDVPAAPVLVFQEVRDGDPIDLDAHLASHDEIMEADGKLFQSIRELLYWHTRTKAKAEWRAERDPEGDHVREDGTYKVTEDEEQQLDEIVNKIQKKLPSEESNSIGPSNF